MIYICIPTHNEQQTVGVVLWKLRQVLTEFHRDYQLLVADDASTDKTPEVLEPYTRVLPLTVIRSTERLGQAASVELLLREAVRRSEYPKRDIIVTLQADFSEEPDDVVPMIKRIEAGVDLVIGNKVSMTRTPRIRRLARAIGSFFTRAQQWPEGVTTPFDGYRAYRLHAVRMALEEGGGRRLVRYDGWAGNAELLRAVLPHARRVEVLDVEDRADRLQRPRRERPIAAALQVRPMLRGVEPPGLVSVEELDRVAATASRSRAGAAPPAQRGAADAVHERGNGRSRERGVAGRPRNGRDRAPARSEGRERGGRSREQAPPKDAAAADRSSAARTAAPPKAGPERGKPRGPRLPEPAEAPAAGALPGANDAAVKPPPAAELDAAAGGASAEAPRPKKRRRRRRRGAAGRADVTQPVGGTEPSSETGIDGEPTAAAEPDEVGAASSERPGAVPGSTEAREPKRRRRRGGRGRRRGPRAAGTDASATDVAGAERGSATSDIPAVTPVTTPAPMPTPPEAREEE